MPAARHDFVTDKGATFRRTLVWRSDPDIPVNLTGYTSRFVLEVRGLSGTWSEQLAVTNPLGVVLTPLAGQLEVVLTSTQTDALSATGRYRHSLFVTAPGGDITRLLHGDFGVVA